MSSQLAVPVPPVTYKLYVNGQVQDVFFMDVELRQRFGRHEIFNLRIEFPQTFRNLAKIPIWASGQPVMIQWGRGVGNLNVFYGYINHHQLDSESDSGNRVYQLKYTCIGTSRYMNSDVTQSWGQVTTTYMAKTIAAKYGLRSVLTQTTWISDNETQTAESDFAFLGRMAEKYGFRFWVSGGTLYFIDPAVVIAGSSYQGIPVFYLNKEITQQDTVRKWRKIEGDNIPGAMQATRVIGGVDQTSYQSFVVAADGTQNRPFTKLQTRFVAATVAEGKVMANAWASLSQFYVQAEAELFGNAYLYPGKLVNIQGNRLPGGAAGLWMITEANHVLMNSGTTVTTLDRYVTRVKLIRNASYSNPVLNGINVVSPEIIPCTANSSGRWQATNLTPLYYGTA